MIHEANLWTCLCDTIITGISVHPFFNHFLRPGDRTGDLLSEVFGKSSACKLALFSLFRGLQQSLPHFIRVVAGYSGQLTGTLHDKHLRLLVFRQPRKALSSLSWCKAFKHPAVQDLNCVWSCQETHVGIRTKDSALHSMNNANFHLFVYFWNFCLLLNILCTGMAGFTWMWRTQNCWSTFPDLVPIFFRLSKVLLRSQGACMSSSA